MRLNIVLTFLLMVVIQLSANEKKTISLGEFDALLKSALIKHENNACQAYKYYDDHLDELLLLETQWDIFKRYYEKYLFDMGAQQAHCFSIKESTPENYMRSTTHKKKKKNKKFSVEQKEAYVKSVIINGSDRGILSNSIKMPGRDKLLNLDTNEMVSDHEINLIAKYVARGFEGSRRAKNAYDAVCRNCHRSGGKGMVFVAPPISQETLKGMLE